MWRFAVPLALFAVIGVFFYRGLSLNPAYVPSALIGKQVPTFALPSVASEQQKVSSADFAGKVALVNVWGTWCIECRHEHGYLLELARAGVPIYGINLRDDRPSAQGWLAALGNPYVGSAFDPEGVVAVDLGVTAAPETFLIGRDGKVLYKHISPLTALVWRRDFLPLIERDCGADQAACPFLASMAAR